MELFSSLPSTPEEPEPRLAGLRCFGDKGRPNLVLRSDRDEQALTMFPTAERGTALLASRDGAFLRLHEHQTKRTFAAYLGSDKKGGGQLALFPPSGSDGRFAVDSGVQLGFGEQTVRPRWEYWCGKEREAVDYPRR